MEAATTCSLPERKVFYHLECYRDEMLDIVQSFITERPEHFPEGCGMMKVSSDIWPELHRCLKDHYLKFENVCVPENRNDSFLLDEKVWDEAFHLVHRLTYSRK